MIKFQRILIASFIVLVPLIYPLVDLSNVRQFQELVFQYGVMALCAYFVGNLWMGLFMSWTLFLFYLNGNSIGHETVLNIFLGIMLFGVSRRFFKLFRFEKEARWIGWVGAISIFFMGLQFLGIDPLHSFVNGQLGVQPTHELRDMVGMFSLKAHNGIYLALVACYATYLFIPLGLVMTAIVGISLSSGAVMASISGVLFYTFYHARRWFIGILVLCILGGAAFTIKDVCFDKKMYLSRLNMWHAVVKSSLQRPIGYGPDSFRQETPFKPFLFGGDEERRASLWIKVPGNNDAYQFVYYDPNPQHMAENYKDIVPKSPNIWDHPHNEYLNILFCWGIPGIVILFFFLRDIARTFRLSDKSKEIVLITSMLIVYAVSSLTQFPLCVARLAYLAPVILGAFYACCEV